MGLFRVASIRARGVASAVLLAGFRWWLALALLSFYVALVRFLGDNCKRGVAAMRGHPQRFRRVDYIRDLALLPAAARELRIFGLAGWVATRFEGLWQTAMVDFWADRRRGRWVPPLSALGITVALDGAARAAGAAEIIAGLPSDWDTVLSRQFAGGCDLSGGEWQRVAPARALLAVRAGAGILVLDEPTAVSQELAAHRG